MLELWFTTLFTYLLYVVVPKTHPPNELMKVAATVAVACFVFVPFLTRSLPRGATSSFIVFFIYGLVTSLPVGALILEAYALDNPSATGVGCLLGGISLTLGVVGCRRSRRYYLG